MATTAVRVVLSARGANFDRVAPLGEEAVSIIKEAWERRQEDPRERAKREAEESEPPAAA